MIYQRIGIINNNLRSFYFDVISCFNYLCLVLGDHCFFNFVNNFKISFFSLFLNMSILVDFLDFPINFCCLHTHFLTDLLHFSIDFTGFSMFDFFYCFHFAFSLFLNMSILVDFLDFPINFCCLHTHFLTDLLSLSIHFNYFISYCLHYCFHYSILFSFLYNDICFLFYNFFTLIVPLLIFKKFISIDI